MRAPLHFILFSPLTAAVAAAVPTSSFQCIDYLIARRSSLRLIVSEHFLSEKQRLGIQLKGRALRMPSKRFFHFIRKRDARFSFHAHIKKGIYSFVWALIMLSNKWRPGASKLRFLLDCFIWFTHLPLDGVVQKIPFWQLLSVFQRNASNIRIYSVQSCYDVTSVSGKTRDQCRFNRLDVETCVCFTRHSKGKAKYSKFLCVCLCVHVVAAREWLDRQQKKTRHYLN